MGLDLLLWWASFLYFEHNLTLPYMGLLSDRQSWGAIMAPLFFLGNYILYGVLVFIFMYIPMFAWQFSDFTYFLLRRYDVILAKNRFHKQKAIVSVKMGRWT